MNHESMNNVGYQVFTIDAENKRIFVTRKPIVPKDKDEELIMQIDKKLEGISFNKLPHTNPDFRASDCEVVDITDWDYNNSEELWYQIRNYESAPKKR